MSFFVSIDQKHIDLLGNLRARPHLKLAMEGNLCWLAGLSEEEIDSKYIQGIPTKKIYAEKSGMLFLYKSSLPSMRIPDVLWTPIDRALRIEVPSYNENYFGLKDEIKIMLIPSDMCSLPSAMLVELDVLEKYLNQAPAVRLSRIKWVLVNGNKALLLGSPLLPIKGCTYWNRGRHFLPEGYDLELHSLQSDIDKKLNIDTTQLSFWNEEGTFQLINEDDFVPLSRSSFRLTLEKWKVSHG